MLFFPFLYSYRCFYAVEFVPVIESTDTEIRLTKADAAERNNFKGLEP